MSKRVLVTGATGFVGRAVCAGLAARDEWMPLAGSRRTAVSVGAGVQGVATPTLGGDANWGGALEGVFAVVHAAARAHVLKESAGDPLAEFRKTNVDGTLSFARQAAAAGVRRFVFLSSIGVNGNETSRPFTEADVPAPQEPYARSKWEAEQGLRDLAAETGMEVVIIRPPLVYGPGAPGNFGALLRWVARGVPLPLGAVTGNRRSLVALDNLVDFILTCLRHPAAANETFLVADGEDVSTAGLLQAVGDAVGRPARLLPVPVGLLRAGAAVTGKRDLARRLSGSLQVDASHAREVLGWTPPVTMSQQLAQCAAAME